MKRSCRRSPIYPRASHPYRHVTVSREVRAMSCSNPPLANATLQGVSLLIPGDDDKPHRAVWYRQPHKDAPLVLHLHAGAFTSAPSTERPTLVEQLLMQGGASVVSLQYPLAPAHPFPQALHAAYAALLHLRKERHRFCGAKAPILVAGAEAGGNIAAGVARMARDRKDLPLAGQILFSPMLDPRIATNSQRQAGAGAASCRYAQGWRQYASRPSDYCHPYAEPASATRLEGLAPALLLTAAGDPFHDETHAYAQRLTDHGIDASFVLLPAPIRLPGAYMNEAPHDAPWMDGARDSLRRFLNRAAACKQPARTPSLSKLK